MSGDITVVRPVALEQEAARPAIPAPPAALAPLEAPPPPAAPEADEAVLALEAGDDEPPARPATNGAIAAAYEDARLRILRSLERGEIDVAEAGRRLESLDAGADDITTVVDTTDLGERGPSDG
jgi:hypothetical protein